MEQNRFSSAFLLFQIHFVVLNIIVLTNLFGLIIKCLFINFFSLATALTVAILLMLDSTDAVDVCVVRTKDVDNCRLVCERSIYCRYFTYQTANKHCYLKVFLHFREFLRFYIR